jgi:hypothetical protein
MINEAININTEYNVFLDSNKELIYDILRMTEEQTRRKKIIDDKKSLLLSKMNSANIPAVNLYGRHIVKVECSRYRKFDTKKFKKDFPQLFDKYSETVYKEEYITIRGAGKNA